MRYLAILGAIVIFVAGIVLGRLQPAAAIASTDAQPTSGWTLHFDADKHFAAHPMEMAHHYCKMFAGGLTECQIYASDAPNAPLVAVETIVSPAVYGGFSPAEKAMWHNHKSEMSNVSALMPGMSPSQTAKTIASLSETYGKDFILWDPAINPSPIGTPIVATEK